jgi:putative membrane protein insertion efficiency factor
LKTLTLWLIKAYRAALIPFFGPSCRFEPSCSRYAEQAIAAHGLARGAGLAALRICRCHPFSRGGLDPVPPASAIARARG